MGEKLATALTDNNPVAGPSSVALQRLLEEARQRLIQTGTRNRLVHCARFAKRGKFIDIVDERADDIFHTLVRDRRKLRFLHDDKLEDEAEDSDVHFHSGEELDLDDSRFADLFLQTQLSEDKLQKRLLGMAREAKTLEEEQGINALYLALGFLRWFEDDNSDVARQAPLILVPVALKRNDLTSLHEVAYRGEDIVTNEPLKHRLNDDFGIRLPEISEDEDWKPGAYFGSVQQAISGKSRWFIDVDGMQLGFFSFAKLLMVKDLEPASWPEEGILANSLVRRLLAEGFPHEADDFPADETLDNLFAPADLIQVVDADSSQTLVIESVRNGRNLVVQGPPGTGKSQTITNIIAAAAHDGKSVLFMAEKMAALNVVYERLKKADLSELCLELHSRQANKKAVHQELSRTLNSPGTAPGQQDGAEELRQIRDRLNGIAEIMHKPIGVSGITPYRTLSTLIKLQEGGFSPANFSIPQIEMWSIEQRNDAMNAVNALAKITQKAGPKKAHPFRGVGNPHILPMDLPRLNQQLQHLLKKVHKISDVAGPVARGMLPTKEVSEGLARQLGAVLNHVSTLGEGSQSFTAAIAEKGQLDAARRITAIGLRYQEMARVSSGVYTETALELPLHHVRQPLAGGLTFFGRWGGAYRRASAELASLLGKQLPKRAEQRIELLDRLLELQKALSEIRGQETIASDLFGPLWRREHTDFAAVNAAVKWLGELADLPGPVTPAVAVSLRQFDPEKLAILGSQLVQMADDARSEADAVVEWLKVDLREAFEISSLEELPYGILAERLRVWADNLDRLDEWSRLLQYDIALRELGCGELADRISSGVIAPEKAADTLQHLQCEALYREFASTEPWITRLTCEDKLELVGGFVAREKSRFRSTARLIKCEHLGKIPRGGMGAMGIIRGEIGRRRGHKPIRKLMMETGPVIQQIKPVMLMSPISIAQFLPPGRLEFDLLVIDEASQVRPEEALGAVARAKQIVVVGDTKQLPPTSFFDRMVADGAGDEEDDESEQLQPRVTSVHELESVLTLCEARGLNKKMLRWHYRSRHPSLIQVSNDEFYRGDLILFPSPAANRKAEGLIVRHVNGAYDRGGRRTNRIEAEAVVDAVVNHASATPNRSLGVATFSTAQRDIITELLELARRENEELDAYLQEGRHEEFFVKNLENVQGDERDVIFVSVGYGPRVAGQRLDSMHFGPVTQDGGERRLNVLFTRARFRTEVFVSFDAADINLDRTKMPGARVLKRFLHFAETGIAEVPQPLGDDADSEFETAVADVIREMGFHVDHQVGSGGFRIDLAVRHPEDMGRYMLAIECDGATYHSALWARERDRLRQEILEGLGWRFHRIWSTDWFHRRPDELKRLGRVLVEAQQQLQEKLAPVPVEQDDDEDDILEDEVVDVIGAVGAPNQLPAYSCARFPVPSHLEPHEVPASRLSEIVGKIIDVEGPIHQQEIARRVGNLFGKQKAGSRIARAVLSALRHLSARDKTYRARDGFWMTAGQEKDPPLRDRSAASLTLRRADMIPPTEIEKAVLHVIRENGAVARDELPRAIALLFGFQRTGPDFNATVSPVIDGMVKREKLQAGLSGLALISSD